MTEYVTVRDVEIVSAGRSWRGGSEYYVTAEHLADMVAAQADPLIRAPRVKLGHWDVIFGALAGMHDPSLNATDGEAGFGTLTNLRLVEGGAKIIGDLTEVPAWLAAAMPSAYPTRSAEWVWDYETAGGHKYTAVLTDLALGGVWEPAVEDLADITREQATQALAALLDKGPEAALAALQITPQEQPVATKTATASVSVDRIVGAFEQWAWGKDSPDELDTLWWWARDVRLDPDEIIASDGEGGTFRVPFNTDGEHDVTFGDPVEVRETYVDITAATAAASAAQARHQQTVLASDLPRPKRPSVHDPASAAVDPNPEVHMDANVREVLVGQGLDPDTATEEQINAASVFAAAGITPTAETPEVDEAETDEEPAEEPETEEEAADEPELVVATNGRTVTVDRSQWEQTQRDAAAGAAARRDQVNAELDSEVDAAIADGRITPATRQEWRNAIDAGDGADPAAAARATAERKSLAGLAKGRVPVITSTASKAAQSDEEALLAASRARMGHTAPKEA